MQVQGRRQRFQMNGAQKLQISLFYGELERLQVLHCICTMPKHGIHESYWPGVGRNAATMPDLEALELCELGCERDKLIVACCLDIGVPALWNLIEDQASQGCTQVTQEKNSIKLAIDILLPSQ